MPPPANRRRATYADVVAAPEWVVAEVVEGELRTSPRPSPRHSFAEVQLATLLNDPFGRGVGGPGGWIVLMEPELHLENDAAILVPDLAAWRLERMPTVPDGAFVSVVPDWVCEILSPSTADFDRLRKLPIYARTGVSHAWLLDPMAHTLEFLECREGVFAASGSYGDAARVSAAPFEAVELDLSELWAR